MPLPKTIEPCPIVDSLVEVRFTPSVPEEAVFGMLYADKPLRDEFPTSQALPILQLPRQIRDVNPHTRFQPYYRLENKNYTISVGPKSFTVGAKVPYPGWVDFRGKILAAFETLIKVNVVKQPSRFGLRYTNLFPGDVYDRLTLSTTLCDQPLSGEKTYFRTEITKQEQTLLLQVGKNASAKVDGKNLQGTIIDIDVSVSSSDSITIDAIAAFIDAAHTNEKQLFYDLLKKDFLETLHPTY
jgi:uncharacterized protein (TIGR04255 family)